MCVYACIFFKDLLLYLKSRVKEGEGVRERKPSISWCTPQWPRLDLNKPEPGTPPQVSHVGGKSLSTWATVCYLPRSRCISRATKPQTRAPLKDDGIASCSLSLYALIPASGILLY